MYIKEFLMFLARLYKIKNPKERVKEVIRLVGLEKEQHKEIGALSKGYRQRVGLAQAIIHNPEVLILDEPTSGLDPNQLVEIRELIKEFGKDKTVLFSTHIMQEVEAICDRVIIINEGRIVADEPIEKIGRLFETKPSVLITFDGDVNLDIFSSLPCEIIDKANNSFLFENKTKKDLRKDISKIAHDNDVLILEMKVVENNLEDVFKKLTKKELV